MSCSVTINEVTPICSGRIVVASNDALREIVTSALKVSEVVAAFSKLKEIEASFPKIRDGTAFAFLLWVSIIQF